MKLIKTLAGKGRQLSCQTPASARTRLKSRQFSSEIDLYVGRHMPGRAYTTNYSIRERVSSKTGYVPDA